MPEPVEPGLDWTATRGAKRTVAYAAFDPAADEGQGDDTPTGQRAERGGAEEPDGKIFKASVRNAFLSVEMSVRAGSKAAAEKVFREWLTSGMDIREG